ncbi:uncharacterized protein YukE [Scopulibacillus daqui]|uniref:Uncharacterized protein YukE n=1 Tax=Scopulibacillus daqui TaxID=1469162 RepID=A0ABS2PVQ1_9BACL|nr:uncharacterized protein YukE [Scopulibacillus daqui]
MKLEYLNPEEYEEAARIIEQNIDELRVVDQRVQSIVSSLEDWQTSEKQTFIDDHKRLISMISRQIEFLHNKSRELRILAEHIRQEKIRARMTKHGQFENYSRPIKRSGWQN